MEVVSKGEERNGERVNKKDDFCSTSLSLYSLNWSITRPNMVSHSVPGCLLLLNQESPRCRLSSVLNYTAMLI